MSWADRLQNVNSSCQKVKANRLTFDLNVRAISRKLLILRLIRFWLQTEAGRAGIFDSSVSRTLERGECHFEIVDRRSVPCVRLPDLRSKVDGLGPLRSGSENRRRRGAEQDTLKSNATEIAVGSVRPQRAPRIEGDVGI